MGQVLHSFKSEALGAAKYLSQMVFTDVVSSLSDNHRSSMSCDSLFLAKNILLMTYVPVRCILFLVK